MTEQYLPLSLSASLSLSLTLPLSAFREVYTLYRYFCMSHRKTGIRSVMANLVLIGIQSPILVSILLILGPLLGKGNYLATVTFSEAVSLRPKKLQSNCSFSRGFSLRIAIVGCFPLVPVRSFSYAQIAQV